MNGERLDRAIKKRFGEPRGRQDRLAKAVGANGAQVTRWLHGVVPDGENLIKVCRVLGVSWAHLLDLDEAESFKELVQIEIQEAFGPRVSKAVAAMADLPPDTQSEAVGLLCGFLKGRQAAPLPLMIGTPDGEKLIAGSRKRKTARERASVSQETDLPVHPPEHPSTHK